MVQPITPIPHQPVRLVVPLIVESRDTRGHRRHVVHEQRGEMHALVSFLRAECLRKGVPATQPFLNKCVRQLLEMFDKTVEQPVLDPSVRGHVLELSLANGNTLVLCDSRFADRIAQGRYVHEPAAA